MNIVVQHYKWVMACVVVILYFSLHPFNAIGKDDPVLSGRLLVGVINAPPYAMKNADGQWEGLGIELWHMIAKDLALQFELHEYSSIGQVQEAIENHELDIVPTAVATASREILMDFSNPYYRSGSAIAVSAESTGFHWLRLAERFFTSNFLKVMGYLALLLLFVGVVMWMFESRRNRDMFGGKPVQGIGQGTWWAAVTMTTVGYGDKAPRTLGGRLAAIVWMIFSIVLVSVLTAGITTSLTISELDGKVRGVGDLHSVRVGSLDQSTTQSSLVERGITAFPFFNEEDGLQAIVDNQIDAFVFDQAVLKYLISSQFPSQLRVLPEIFDSYYVSIGMPNGSPFREWINRSLLKVMATPDWLKLVDHYLGLGP